MSGSITLTLRGSPDAPVSMHGVQPHRLAGLSEHDIANTPVTMGRRLVPLGDLFVVQGGRSSSVQIDGSSPRLEGLGAGMQNGELTIHGDAGPEVGSAMAGGRIHVRGNAGNDAGAAMSGGLLLIDGNAGERLGAALPGASHGMTGGEIIVVGSTGDDTGARVRRGLIVVAGNVGRGACRAMIAGSVLVLGSCGENGGRGNKRGSLVVCGPISIPPTYRYACTFNPPHLRLTLLYLSRRHRLDIPAAALDGRFRRYCGDAGHPGKGEILELVRDV